MCSALFSLCLYAQNTNKSYFMYLSCHTSLKGTLSALARTRSFKLRKCLCNDKSGNPGSLRLRAQITRNRLVRNRNGLLRRGFLEILAMITELRLRRRNTVIPFRILASKSSCYPDRNESRSSGTPNPEGRLHLPGHPSAPCLKSPEPFMAGKIMTAGHDRLYPDEPP